MELRKKLGGMAEEAINKAIDDLDVEGLKKKVVSEVENLIDELVSNYVDDFKEKVKANYIDLIDGEDDIKDIE
jgi:hypothetical protein